MRKTLSLVLISLLINLPGVNYAFPDSKGDDNSRVAEKVNAGINKLGTGEDARVEVILYDKTRLKGYVKETSSTSFLLADAKSGTVTTVHYPQVKKLKAYNLSTGQKVAVGVGVSLGVLFLIWVLISTSD